MRHRKTTWKLGRTTAHRLSTLRNIAAGLFEHGQVVTTLPRAKAVQPFVEKIITLARRGDIHSRRLIAGRMGRDRKAFDWQYLHKDADEAERALVQRTGDAARAFFDIPESSKVERNRWGEIRKSPKLVKHIVDNIAPRYKDRAGGYTRIVKLGKRRVGDAGELVVIQFVGAEEGPEIGGNISTRRRIADKRTAFAAKAIKKPA